MAFTTADFEDLLCLLEQRPDLRAELRRLLLPEEFIQLPAIVQRLAGVEERLGRSVIPVVAGRSIIPEALDLARARGVWRLLDGQVTPPEEP